MPKYFAFMLFMLFAGPLAAQYGDMTFQDIADKMTKPVNDVLVTDSDMGEWANHCLLLIDPHPDNVPYKKAEYMYLVFDDAHFSPDSGIPVAVVGADKNHYHFITKLTGPGPMMGPVMDTTDYQSRFWDYALLQGEMLGDTIAVWCWLDNSAAEMFYFKYANQQLTFLYDSLADSLRIDSFPDIVTAVEQRAYVTNISPVRIPKGKMPANVVLLPVDIDRNRGRKPYPWADSLFLAFQADSSGQTTSDILLAGSDAKGYRLIMPFAHFDMEGAGYYWPELSASYFNDTLKLITGQADNIEEEISELYLISYGKAIPIIDSATDEDEIIKLAHAGCAELEAGNIGAGVGDFNNIRYLNASFGPPREIAMTIFEEMYARLPASIEGNNCQKVAEMADTCFSYFGWDELTEWYDDSGVLAPYWQDVDTLNPPIVVSTRLLANALGFIADRYMRANRPDGAAKLYQFINEMFTDEPDAYQYLGDAYSKIKGDEAFAALAYEKYNELKKAQAAKPGKK